MQPTRWGWTIAGLGLVLVVFAPLVGSIVPAVGAAIVGAMLLAGQLRAVRQFRTASRSLSAAVVPATGAVRVGTDLSVTVRIDRPPDAAGTALAVCVPVPVGADLVGVDRPSADDHESSADRPSSTETTDLSKVDPTGFSEDNLTIGLSPGDTTAEVTVSLRFLTAGRFELPPPDVRVRDRRGVFTERLTVGDPRSVTVEAATPGRIHVGRGGDDLGAFGEHPTGRTGSGLTPAQLRAYVEGDPADRIDWNATARLGEAYVREFEVETDRRTVLVFDHAPATAIGPPGRSIHAVLREVGLTMVDVAAGNGDPLGLVTVDHDGITGSIETTRTAAGYARIREALFRSEPTPTDRPRSPTSLGHPATAREALARLETDGSRFAERLRPFADRSPAYVERVETHPRYGAVRFAGTIERGDRLLVLATDDRDPAGLREAVRLAVRRGDTVLLLLTPRVLFESDGLADIDAAYRRYTEFESLRQSLDSLPKVTALEVGPSDRIGAVLAAGRDGAGRNESPRRPQTAPGGDSA